MGGRGGRGGWLYFCWIKSCFVVFVGILEILNGV